MMPHRWVWKWDRTLHRALHRRALLFIRRVCGFFNVPQIFYYMCKGLWDGAYGLSSLSEKTRKSNRLFLPSYFKDPECWSGRGLNLRPPAQQSGAYPTELTGRRLYCSDVNNLAQKLNNSVQIVKITGHARRRKVIPGRRSLLQALR